MPIKSTTGTLVRPVLRRDIAFGGAIAVLLGVAGLVAFLQPHPRFDHPLPSSDVKISTSVGHGSGVAIGDGYILTAAHVVTEEGTHKLRDIKVKSDDGVEQDGEVLWASTTYDVALVRATQHATAISALTCAPTKVGQDVSAAGNPQEVEFVTTSGKVGGAERSLGDWPEAVPVSMPILPGQSGGGVLDSNGRVVGLVVGALNTEFGIGAVGAMVPSTTVCRLMGRT